MSFRKIVVKKPHDCGGKRKVVIIGRRRRRHHHKGMRPLAK